MIDLSYWPVPNGWKVSIVLEEPGMEPHHAGGMNWRAEQVLFEETGQR